ncbi:hypothetical protein L345_06203, partial [Ophiophagus hannah]
MIYQPVYRLKEGIKSCPEPAPLTYPQTLQEETHDSGVHPLATPHPCSSEPGKKGGSVRKYLTGLGEENVGTRHSEQCSGYCSIVILLGNAPLQNPRRRANGPLSKGCVLGLTPPLCKAQLLRHTYDSGNKNHRWRRRKKRIVASIHRNLWRRPRLKKNRSTPASANRPFTDARKQSILKRQFFGQRRRLHPSFVSQQQATSTPRARGRSETSARRLSPKQQCRNFWRRQPVEPKDVGKGRLPIDITVKSVSFQLFPAYLELPFLGLNQPLSIDLSSTIAVFPASFFAVLIRTCAATLTVTVLQHSRFGRGQRRTRAWRKSCERGLARSPFCHPAWFLRAIVFLVGDRERAALISWAQLQRALCVKCLAFGSASEREEAEFGALICRASESVLVHRIYLRM